MLDLLEPHLPFRLIKVHHEPDPTFPHGVPNPLLPENRQATAAAVRRSWRRRRPAWDGDFDRCFFFDEQAASSKAKYRRLPGPGLARPPSRAAIIHDPRLTWNTIEVVRRGRRRPHHEQDRARLHQGAHAGGRCLYGGEMSGTITSGISPTATAA